MTRREELEKECSLLYGKEADIRKRFDIPKDASGRRTTRAIAMRWQAGLWAAERIRKPIFGKRRAD